MSTQEIFIDEFKLFDTLLLVTHSLDEELQNLNETGIFFVPELYFVFEVGKALYKKRKEIFGLESIKWVREKDLGNGGPSDLVFETESDQVVFEFKIANTYNSYLSDIKKLESLKKPNRRSYLYFVALIDSFRGKSDPRVEEVHKGSGYRPIYDVSFPSNYSGYQSEIDCRAVLYSI
ncbi:hypothetical protein [Algoriphagus formosus]|uniref:hypothetical protein n=1 Tax=Algoriphagus formosus TaxID=2007308 RepID=UPI000C294321|nr:hypothetical protein [Algoriphagus formosus]